MPRFHLSVHTLGAADERGVARGGVVGFGEHGADRAARGECGYRARGMSATSSSSSHVARVAGHAGLAREDDGLAHRAPRHSGTGALVGQRSA